MEQKQSKGFLISSIIIDVIALICLAITCFAFFSVLDALKETNIGALLFGALFTIILFGFFFILTIIFGLIGLSLSAKDHVDQKTTFTLIKFIISLLIPIIDLLMLILIFVL